MDRSLKPLRISIKLGTAWTEVACLDQSGEPVSLLSLPTLLFFESKETCCVDNTTYEKSLKAPEAHIEGFFNDLSPQQRKIYEVTVQNASDSDKTLYLHTLQVVNLFLTEVVQKAQERAVEHFADPGVYIQDAVLVVPDHMFQESLEFVNKLYAAANSLNLECHLIRESVAIAAYYWSTSKDVSSNFLLIFNCGAKHFSFDTIYRDGTLNTNKLSSSAPIGGDEITNVIFEDLRNRLLSETRISQDQLFPKWESETDVELHSSMRDVFFSNELALRLQAEKVKLGLFDHLKDWNEFPVWYNYDLILKDEHSGAVSRRNNYFHTTLIKEDIVGSAAIQAIVDQHIATMTKANDVYKIFQDRGLQIPILIVGGGANFPLIYDEIHEHFPNQVTFPSADKKLLQTCGAYGALLCAEQEHLAIRDTLPASLGFFIKGSNSGLFMMPEFTVALPEHTALPSQHQISRKFSIEPWRDQLGIRFYEKSASGGLNYVGSCFFKDLPKGHNRFAKLTVFLQKNGLLYVTIEVDYHGTVTQKTMIASRESNFVFEELN